MNLFFYRIYVESIRKIINHSFLKSFLINYLPNWYSVSESIYVRYKDTESNLLNILADNEKRSLDIGALWGGYSHILSRVSKNVIVFEPNSKNYEFLLHSFKNYTNVEIINAAVSDISQRTILKVPENNPGNATIDDHNIFNDSVNFKNFEVEAKKIDELNLTNIGFIKIDIEGHEFSALRGMEILLKEQEPNLLVEIEERHNKGSIDNVTSFMNSLGYEVYFISEAGIHKFKDFKIDIYQNSINRNTRKYINNFIFIPGNRSEKILSLFSEHGIKSLIN